MSEPCVEMRLSTVAEQMERSFVNYIEVCFDPGSHVMVSLSLWRLRCELGEVEECIAKSKRRKKKVSVDQNWH